MKGREQALRVADRSLVEALGLPAHGALVSIVGGGGKSALLFALAERLAGRVVLTTTTRIFTAQIERAVQACAVGDADFESKLQEGRSGLLVIGRVEGEKALGVDPGLPAAWLARENVEHVVVEADGSRMRPVKAPADHEPVIAQGTTHLVIAVGIDALDGPIDELAHRPERVRHVLGEPHAVRLDPTQLARLIAHRDAGLKNVGDETRVVVVINKVEDARRRELADAVAREVLREQRIERVIVGALEGATPDDWTLYQRSEC